MNILLKHKIKKYNVISFDIFDTLLLRPYMRPTDLFYHMEQYYQEYNFAFCRMQAEEKARIHYALKEEITLDEIYEFMSSKFHHLKSKEIEFEMQVLQPNPQMKEVFDIAVKMKKDVIITSDMYLDINIIRQILKQKGYVGFKKIYLSSDIKKTKESGHLFEYILSDLGVKAKDIFHLGDNKKSDVKVPKKMGISAYHYKTIRKQFLSSDKKYDKFWKEEQNNFEASVLLGVLSIHYAQNKKFSFFKKLGYSYAGPVAYGFMYHLKKIAQINKIQQFLFVARDGYSLKKVFEIINSDQKSYYIYANRFLYDLTHLSSKETNTLISIIQYYQKKNSEIKQLLSQNPNWKKSPIDFIKQNIDCFKKLAKEELKNYQSYLFKEVDKNKKTALIDTVTINFSAQTLIKNAGFEKNLMGYYWAVSGSENNLHHPHESYGYDNELPFSVFTKNWNFVEFIFSSPENPILTINTDGKAVYMEKPSKYELYRKKVYPFVCDGICDFTKDICKYFDEKMPSFSISLVIKWLNNYFDGLSYKDIKYLKNIYYSSDSEHNCYKPLFPYFFAKKYVVSKIKKIFKTSWKRIRKRAIKKMLILTKTKKQQIYNPDYTLMDANIDTVLTNLGHFSFCPNTGNMGDFIIAEAEYRLFQQKKYDYEIYDRSILNQAEQPENFVYGGGGVFVSYWCPKVFVELFKNKNIKNIVILPASFYQCPQLIEVLDERFTIFCREKFSYDYLKTANTKANIYLSHDMALGLKPVLDMPISTLKISQFLQTSYKRPMKEIYAKLYLPYQSVYHKMETLLKSDANSPKVGYFLRTDVEGTKEVSALGIKNTFDISMCAIGLCSDSGMVGIYTQLFFAGLMTADIIVTDRLHVGIGAALLGKEVVYLDNSYHKILGVYQKSMTKFKNVHLASTEDFKDILEQLKRTVKPTADTLYLEKMNLEYTDFLMMYLTYRQFQDQRIINVLWNT